jgi:aspartate beta-hydroxylase
MASSASVEILADTVRRGERAVRERPQDVRAHDQLFKAIRALLDRNGSAPALAAICRDLPHAYTSLLHLARLQEAVGDRRAALLGYLRAIKTARAAGFWHAEASTPPWLRPLVQHAMKTAHDGRIGFFHEWLEPMEQRHGKDEMARVAACLAMYLGTAPTVYGDPRQRPTFLYFPGLPVAPTLPRADLPFADWYEAQTDAIRAEMHRVLETGADVQPFHHAVPSERQGMLTRGGSWDAYFFYRHGETLADHHAACPRTSEILGTLPLDHVREHGPEVLFSVMRPGAHILPHRGVTNVRSVLHLGLDVPDDCALRLTGITELTWAQGRCFAFDDTYEHEAWNRSDRTRVILLGDIWNPYLRAPEREAIADLIGVIGDFNRATTPPPAGGGSAPSPAGPPR